MGQKQTDPAGSSQPPSAGESHRKRNLANQRNYRNRQKQYVDELEHKLRAYEREGAEATESVQRAARRVHEENAALRRLIYTHLGWSQQEVDDRLLREQANIPPMMYSRNDLFETQRIHNDLGKYSLTPPDPVLHTERSDAARAADDAKIEPLSSSSWMKASIQHDRTELDYPKYRPYDSLPQQPTTKDSMSCEDAAAILAEFRSQGDLDLIKGELGCAPVPSRSCSISHRDLFARLADST